MVFQSTIKEEEQVVPLSPLPSLELEASSSSSDDNDTSSSTQKKDDVSASPSNSNIVILPSSMRNKSDYTASIKKKNQPPAKASWWDSMLNGYSFIHRLTIVLVVILSWYYAHHRTAVNIWQNDDMMEYEEEEEEEEEDFLSPWDIWGQGFDFDKQRNYWIADEDLPADIATDLQSTNSKIQDEALARRQLDPFKWDTFGYWEIYHYFACDKIFSTSIRPVWSEQLFRNVRDFYHDFKEVEDDGNNSSTDSDSDDGTVVIPSTYQATKEVYNMSQNAIPYQSGGSKGRGLKAARDIQQGEIIFKQTNNTIIFNDGQTFRKFLFKMNDRFSDPGMVCDILVWAWVQDNMEEDNSNSGEIPFVGVVDLDNGNLLNDFGLGDNLDVPLEELEDIVNIQCAGGGAACYASKDISEGEELLGDYSEFVSYYSWTSMGL